MRPLFTHGDAGRTTDRPTVVLLHSSGSSSRQWAELVARLGDRFDTHAVDLHGHGARPDWPSRGPLTLADEVALVVPTLQAAGAVHLVGHSYGGAVAIKVAEMFPHAVRSIAVYEPVLFAWLHAADIDADVAHEVRALADAIRRCLHERRYRRAAEHFVDYWSGPGTWARMPAARQQSIAPRMPAILAHFDALHREPLSLDALPASVPVLSLSGANSPPSTQRIAQMIRWKRPSADCEELPGLGHMGPITHAAMVVGRIERFLSQCVYEPGAETRAALWPPVLSPATPHSPSRAALPPVRTPSPVLPRTASG